MYDHTACTRLRHTMLEHLTMKQIGPSSLVTTIDCYMHQPDTQHEHLPLDIHICLNSIDSEWKVNEPEHTHENGADLWKIPKRYQKSEGRGATPSSARGANKIPKMQVLLDGGEGEDGVLCQLINNKVNHMRHNIEMALKKEMQCKLQWVIEKMKIKLY